MPGAFDKTICHHYLSIRKLSSRKTPSFSARRVTVVAAPTLVVCRTNDRHDPPAFPLPRSLRPCRGLVFSSFSILPVRPRRILRHPLGQLGQQSRLDPPRGPHAGFLLQRAHGPPVHRPALAVDAAPAVAEPCRPALYVPHPPHFLAPTRHHPRAT